MNYERRLVLLNEEACGVLAAVLHQERCEELLVELCKNWQRFEALILQFEGNPSFAPSTAVVLNIFRIVRAGRAFHP